LACPAKLSNSARPPAPPQPAGYRSLWKAFDIGGNPFGVGFSIDIVVD